MYKTGMHVRYIDERGVVHDALITQDWNGHDRNDDASTVNLIYVSDDPARKDQYGEQMVRDTSVAHYTKQTVMGRCWMLESEWANGIVQKMEELRLRMANHTAPN